jgi:predicted nucleotidyltransferase
MNQQIFKEIQSLKRQLLPNEKVILFGSQARGDAHEESDWDLLVLLEKEKKTKEDDDKFAFPFVLMGWEYGAYISVKLFTKKDWELNPSLFRYNIEQEGIEIV